MRKAIIISLVNVFVLCLNAFAQPESVDTDELWDKNAKFEFKFTETVYSDTVKVDKYLSALFYCDTISHERYIGLRNDEPFVYEMNDTTIVWTFFDLAPHIHFKDFDLDGLEDLFVNYFHWGMAVIDNSFYFKNEADYTRVELPVGKIIMVENSEDSKMIFTVIVPKSHIEIVEVDFKNRKAVTLFKFEKTSEYEEYVKK